MSNPFNQKNAPYGVDAPATHAAHVTSFSDTADLPRTARAFYATTVGNIAVDLADGTTVTIPVAAFQLVPLAIVRIRATGTTVSSVVTLS